MLPDPDRFLIRKGEVLYLVTAVRLGVKQRTSIEISGSQVFFSLKSSYAINNKCF